MNLQNGARLGPYEIDSRLGAGGMGEVYRARDVRLQRTVAIKILPPRFADEPGLKARFEREARAISSLNDPHICALYDIGHEKDLAFLVMEYCEGASLADRVQSGKFPIEQALRFGMQIAGALEKAHHAGVIHRDVKPSNIMITRSGVKLLDFGLAAGEFITGDGRPEATTEHRVTQSGQILGTLTYMAPEVLRGSPADERSDVFALGLVLYEMMTGQCAFQAGDRATIVARILEHEPTPLPELAPHAPPALDRLVRSCLSKDPDQRVQSAHDVRLQLEWILESSLSIRPAPVKGDRKRSWIALASALGGMAIASGLWWVLRDEPLSPPPLTASRSVIDLRDAAPVALGKFAPAIGYFSTLVALSHDGNLLVYVGVSEGETQLFLRRIDRFGVEPIPGTRGAYHAFFSPDDRWIGFFAGGKVLKLPVAGGSPIALAEITQPVRGIWNSDGIWVVGILQVGLLRVPEGGGPAEVINREIGPLISDVLPGGRYVLTRDFRKSNGDFDRVIVFDLETKTRKTVIERGYDARYVAPDHLIFARSGDLHRVQFDVAKLETIGEPVLLQEDVSMESLWGQAQYAISRDGDLAFLPGDDRSVGKLAWVGRDGRAEFLPVPARLYGVFSLSPDEKRIATEISDVNDSIFLIDLERQETRRLPNPFDVRRPEWLADGRLIFSRATEDEGPLEIVATDPDSGEVSKVLTDAKVGFVLVTASPSGRTIVAHRVERGSYPVHLFHIGRDAPPVPLPGAGTASFSPDEKWIAYVRRGVEEGREIVVAPPDDPGRAQQVSFGGGGEPLWCRRCPDLFYRNGARWYAVRPPATAGDRWGSPRLVWETEFVDTQGRSFDVSADGLRLLVSKRPTADITDRIHMVQHWPSLLPDAAR